MNTNFKVTSKPNMYKFFIGSYDRSFIIRREIRSESFIFNTIENKMVCRFGWKTVNTKYILNLKYEI